MKAVYGLLGFGLLTIAAPAVAQTYTSDFEAVSKPEEVDNTSQAADVRFRNDGFERMTVPVHLSGNGPYRFLVDTGADRTAVSRQLAERLKLRQNSKARLHSVTGFSEVSLVAIPILDMAVKQMRDVDAPLLESSHMGADGILGLDALRSQRILFDFKAQTLTLVPSRERPLDYDEDAIVVTARQRNGRLILSQARANGQGLAVVVDTGSQISIGNHALRRKLGRRGLIPEPQPVEILSVTGEKLTGEYVFLRELEIGGVKLYNLPILFADSYAFRQLNLEEKPAMLLGMNALRGFEKVSIDFASRKLRVVLPESSALDGAFMAARQVPHTATPRAADQ